MLKYLRAKFKPATALTLPIDLDPFAQSFIESPYPALAQLRQNAPVYRCHNGSWVLSRHADISAALADSRLSNTPSEYAVVHSRHSSRYTCADVANNTLPFMDAPQHSEARRNIARLFHAHMHKQPQDKFQPKNTPSDLLHEFATPLCAKTLCNLFGIPAQQQSTELYAQLKSWADWFFYLFSAIPSQQHRQQLDIELQNFRQFCRELLHQKQQYPGDDFPSALVAHHTHTTELSENFLADNCMLLLADGLNADYAITNALQCLLEQPDKIDLLRAKPGLIPAAADELLRYDTSVIFIARRAREDIPLHNQIIKANSGVLLMLAAANRDPEVFREPDTLNFTRDKNPYLSFGRGLHGCIGRVLVKHLLEQSLLWLCTEAPQFTLAHKQARWQVRAGHRWLQDLAVRLN